MIRKIILGIKSILLYCGTKIRYRGRIQIPRINSIKGKLNIEFLRGATLRVGDFLMTPEPLYIKMPELIYETECF